MSDNDSHAGTRNAYKPHTYTVMCLYTV